MNCPRCKREGTLYVYDIDLDYVRFHCDECGGFFITEPDKLEDQTEEVNSGV